MPDIEQNSAEILVAVGRVRAINMEMDGRLFPCQA
jgi:hypothetical protein